MDRKADRLIFGSEYGCPKANGPTLAVRRPLMDRACASGPLPDAGLPWKVGRYGREKAVRYLRAAAHVGHFMAERDASVSNIDLAAFEQHLRTCRCPCVKGGRRNHYTIYGARLFRRHLEEIGVRKTAFAAMGHAEPQWSSTLNHGSASIAGHPMRR